MIAKVEVRKRLALYEDKLKERQKSIQGEIRRMNESCTTLEMDSIWHRSKEYAKLMTELQVLREVLFDIIDIRCDEMFEDDE